MTLPPSATKAAGNQSIVDQGCLATEVNTDSACAAATASAIIRICQAANATVAATYVHAAADGHRDTRTRTRGVDAKAAHAAAAAAAASGKIKKKKIEKTSVVWEVKPAEVETDLDEVEAKIRAITQEGLRWGQEFKKVPVAFGIVKLVISAVVEDEKTSLTDIEEEIESWEEVGSLDQLDMQKVT
jgi:elongation factor 1-beta